MGRLYGKTIGLEQSWSMRGYRRMRMGTIERRMDVKSMGLGSPPIARDGGGVSGVTRMVTGMVHCWGRNIGWRITHLGLG